MFFFKCNGFFRSSVACHKKEFDAVLEHGELKRLGCVRKLLLTLILKYSYLCKKGVCHDHG